MYETPLPRMPVLGHDHHHGVMPKTYDLLHANTTMQDITEPEASSMASHSPVSDFDDGRVPALSDTDDLDSDASRDSHVHVPANEASQSPLAFQPASKPATSNMTPTNSSTSLSSADAIRIQLAHDRASATPRRRFRFDPKPLKAPQRLDSGVSFLVIGSGAISLPTCRNYNSVLFHQVVSAAAPEAPAASGDVVNGNRRRTRVKRPNYVTDYHSDHEDDDDDADAAAAFVLSSSKASAATGAPKAARAQHKVRSNAVSPQPKKAHRMPAHNGHQHNGHTHGPSSSSTTGGGVRRTKTCACCGTSNTPLWRDVQPDLPLCNACGIRYKKYNKICSSCHYVPCKSERDNKACSRCGDVLHAKNATAAPPRK